MRDVRARGESVSSHVHPPPPIHTRQATHARRDARDGIECDTTRRLNVYRGWSHRLANGQSCWPHERLAPLGEEAFCACEQSVSETQKQKQTRPLLRRIHRVGAWIINPGKPRQGSECLARAICKNTFPGPDPYFGVCCLQSFCFCVGRNARESNARVSVHDLCAATLACLLFPCSGLPLHECCQNGHAQGHAEKKSASAMLRRSRELTNRNSGIGSTGTRAINVLSTKSMLCVQSCDRKHE